MIVGLVAAYQEDAHELALVIANLRQACGHVIVLADPADDPPALFSNDWHRVTWATGVYAHERDKRNALLHLAKARSIGRGDWLLSLDSDERLVFPWELGPLLARFRNDLPAYPLPRVEPDGVITLAPCKLLCGDVDRFVYLDYGVEWRGESWDLDPITVPGHRALIGWPHVVHYGSARADRPDLDGFYTEEAPLTAGRRYFDGPPYDEGLIPEIGIVK